MPTTIRYAATLPRRIVEAAILGAILLAIAATWHIRAFVVAGPSMAETLVGMHRKLACPDCGWSFRCGADEAIMLGKQAICPNCGYRAQRLDAAPRLPADGVLVDRSAFLLRPPRRWELAALRDSNRGSRFYVKRLVGLPGEQIDLRHGDIYADGVIQRKNFAQQRALAVMVHDSSREPSSLPSRWQPDNAKSAWRQSGSRFWRPPTSIAGPDAAATDWLTFHHRRRRPGRDEVLEEVPIADDDGYNQTRPVTQTHLIRDLMVRCRIRGSDSGRAMWLITDGLSQFLITLDFGAVEASIVQDGRRIARVSLPKPLAVDDLLCELALCDEQVLLALDGRETLRVAYASPDVPFRPTSRPVAVGTRGDALEIWELALLRDVYYSPARVRDGKPAQDCLAGDEYFVLGDNSPASLDSRGWAHAGIAGRNIVGRPVLAYPSRLYAENANGQFQVPDFTRFRYIH
jgi:predicted RNA-binding Zn-ribbon protein involved in translation (DUF1610 family)